VDWQNWTYGFREEFQNAYGYDPLPYFAYSFCGGDAAACERFNADLKEIIDRMYFENGWEIAKKKNSEAGLEGPVRIVYEYSK